MGKKGPVELGDMEIFSDVLEDLAERSKEVRQTFIARDPEHVQEAFGHSAEFSTAWAASIAAIDQAYTDGFVPNEEQKTLLYAYLYEFLSPVYEKAEVRQLGENRERLADREPQDAKETKRREEVDFLTGFITQHYPTVDPQVEVRPLLEADGLREIPSVENEVTVEFTGPTGERETFTVLSRDLTRDDDPGAENIANHLYERFEPQPVREEQDERER